jgi:hypothetical protein
MLLHGDVDFRSRNEREVLIVAGSVSDAHVFEYVSVLVSKLETLLHSCISNCRHFSIGRCSLASPRKLIPVDRRSPYSASRVEEGLSSLRVSGEGTIHTVQLTKIPRAHSRGVRRLRGLMATIVTAGLSGCPNSTQRTVADPPLHSPGVSICRHPPSIRSPLPTHFL